MFFSIYSIGRMADLAQTPVEELDTITSELGLKPSSRINGIPHYKSDDLKRVLDAVKAKRATSGEGSEF